MVDAEKVTEISEECQKAIKSLWEDKSIQTCFHRRNEFQISDSAKLLAHKFVHHCMYTLNFLNMLFYPSLHAATWIAWTLSVCPTTFQLLRMCFEFVHRRPQGL